MTTTAGFEEGATSIGGRMDEANAEARTSTSPTSYLHETGRASSEGQPDGVGEGSELPSDSDAEMHDEAGGSLQDLVQLVMEDSIRGTHFYIHILDAYENNYDQAEQNIGIDPTFQVHLQSQEEGDINKFLALLKTILVHQCK